MFRLLRISTLTLPALAVMGLAAGLTGCHEEWMECQTRCAAEPDTGPCDAAFIRYYFDQDLGECREFLWGGCDGTVPFETLEECKDCGCEGL